MSDVGKIPYYIEKINTMANENKNTVPIIEEYLDKLCNQLDYEMKQAKTESRPPLSTNQIIELKKTIGNLEKTQQIEIFKSIQTQCNYTENSNGIFINMLNMSNEILWKLSDLSEYFIYKNKKLDEEQTIRDNILSEVNFDNTESYDNNITKYTNTDSEIQQKINLEKINFNDVELGDDETKLLKSQFDNFNEISLTNKKPRFSGIDARIIKKCKELSKMETSSSE
jgi:hypothetical protein